MQHKPSKLSFFNLPSVEQFPDINQSLKMINTINAIPNQLSLDNLDLPLENSHPAAEDDSLAERISRVPTTANSAKKKKIGCTCKKTFCLKMYCECFSSGRECGEDCACLSCKNTLEFKEEVAMAKGGVKEGGLRNCTLAQKRCNCRKSYCLKRYCECYNAGVTCSESCKCDGCKNTEAPGHLDPSDPQEDLEEVPK